VIVELPDPWPSRPTGGDQVANASLAVTVSVEARRPFAVTELGAAVSIDWAAATAPAMKPTVAVCKTVSASVVSVAV
jgi:hypothetical protein